MGLNILHISDIHLCANPSPSAASLLLGNEFQNGAPDIILVTGDLFDCHAFDSNLTQEEIDNNIQQGVLFCRELIQLINDTYGGSLDNHSMFFVPGNHEMVRSAKTEKDYLQNYIHFLSEYYDSDIPSWYLSDYSFVKDFPDKKVVLIGFRSPYFHPDDGKKEYDDYGLVHDSQLFRIRKKLHEIKGLSEYSVVAALHHQFVLMEERNKTYVDTSYLRNSESFLSFLANENVMAVFHGHKHANSNKRINIELDITRPEKMVTVLGCGSLSEADQENWFNYVTIYPRDSKYEIELAAYQRTTANYRIQTGPLKLPISSQRQEILRVEYAITENPDLEAAYGVLKQYDTVTQTEAIYHILNNTLFSLPGILNQISETPDILYFILATAHYRFLLSQNAPRFILEKVNNFIAPKLKEYSLDGGSFESLVTCQSINELSSTYNQIIESLNGAQRKMIVFSAMVSLITDFFLITKYQSESFFAQVVSKKIDFSYSGHNLSSELQGNTVDFSIDDDRRSLEIGVSCDTPEAVKICSLIIKEFEIILHYFERDFADYGLRVYYVSPKLKFKGLQKNELESRQFTSYIPKLLPLLAGRNIYSKPEAFAREVIQNSIDAINVRQRHDPQFHESGKIEITFGRDACRNLAYFEIKDNGSGMTKYILERYLTTLGLSYYSGADYQSLNIEYDPISQFGIGFLSCFMVGKHIEVHSRHYSSAVGYYLDIPNFDGCFFIEETPEYQDIGTTIRIWENPDYKNTEFAFNQERITEFIQRYILNIDTDIFINGKRMIPCGHLYDVLLENTKRFHVFHFIALQKKEPPAYGPPVQVQTNLIKLNSALFYIKRIIRFTNPILNAFC